MRRNVVVPLLLVLVVVPGAILAVQHIADQDLIPVHQWGAPPFWTPPGQAQALRAVSVGTNDAVVPSPPLPFVAVTPCRIFDTRVASGFSGAFGPPSLVPDTARTVPIPSNPTCTGLPADAAAWSLNFVAIGVGTGYTTAFLSSFPTGGTFSNTSIVNFVPDLPSAGMAVIQAGTGGAIDIYANHPADVVIDINGYYTQGSFVRSLNTLTGDVTLSPGANIAITPSGNDLQIAATVPAGPTGPTGPTGPVGPNALPIFDNSGAGVTGPHAVLGSAVTSGLTTSTVTINFAGSAAFSSGSSYHCFCTGETDLNHNVLVTSKTSTSFTVQSANSSAISFSYLCVGN